MMCIVLQAMHNKTKCHFQKLAAHNATAQHAGACLLVVNT